MKNKLIAGILVFAFMTTMVFAGPTMAYIPPNTPDGTSVAIVDSFTSPNGGTLPYIDTAFDPFNFTTVPWGNVDNATLAQFQIVVLVVDTAPQVALSAQARQDLVAWVSNGGKLIIYDSEMSAIDYSWLPYPFTTNNPGQLGAYGTVVYKEENTLGSTNPSNTAYYLDLVAMATSTDAVGDSNVIVTLDPHWCGDIQVINALQTNSWTHMYALYGSGLFIYNGLDIDYVSSSTVPDASSGTNTIAKIFLLELLQPWGADYNLPCGTPVIEEENPVGGIVINPALMAPIAIAIAVALIAASLIVFSTFYRKGSHAIQ